VGEIREAENQATDRSNFTCMHRVRSSLGARCRNCRETGDCAGELLRTFAIPLKCLPRRLDLYGSWKPEKSLNRRKPSFEATAKQVFIACTYQGVYTEYTLHMKTTEYLSSLILEFHFPSLESLEVR